LSAARPSHTLIPSLCDAPLTLKLMTLTGQLAKIPSSPVLPRILPGRKPRGLACATKKSAGVHTRKETEREETLLKVAVLTSGGVAPV
jgi:hypothetical protein